MPLRAATAVIVAEDPNWVGADHEGGFYATPLSVSEAELALPDMQWETIRGLYVNGLTRDARAAFGAWFDEQRAKRIEETS